MTRAFLLCAVLAALSVNAASRMDRTRFQIGVFGYDDRFKNEACVKELKDCGIDYVYGVPVMMRSVLDNLAKYGIGCAADSAIPKPWGACTRKVKLLEGDVDARFAAALEEFKAKWDHPAIWMFDFCDEPNAVDMPDIGRQVGRVRAACPDIPAYVNLLPNYALAAENSTKQVESQLGTSNYVEHVATYDRCVPLDFLSFDNYPYCDNREKSLGRVERLHDNFRIAADVCRRSGRSLWFVPQANARPTCQKMTLNKMRFQAYLAMAYGAESLTWACWYPRWWDHNVDGKDGVRDDEVYEWLKTVNAEIHAVSPLFMRYRNTRTDRIGTGGTATRYDDGFFRNLKATDGSALTVGGMVGRNGNGRAVFICASADPWGEDTAVRTVTFECSEKASAWNAQGPAKVVRTKTGVQAVRLTDSQFVFVYLP